MDKKFEFYDKAEIKEILKSKEKLVYVDDGMNEIIIKYKDLPEYIVDTNNKNGITDLTVYAYPDQSMNPLLTTMGMFLDKCDPEVRADIIDRLIELQFGAKVKDYKIMDEYVVEAASSELLAERRKNDRER